MTNKDPAKKPDERFFEDIHLDADQNDFAAFEQKFQKNLKKCLFTVDHNTTSKILGSLEKNKTEELPPGTVLNMRPIKNIKTEAHATLFKVKNR